MIAVLEGNDHKNFIAASFLIGKLTFVEYLC